MAFRVDRLPALLAEVDETRATALDRLRSTDAAAVAAASRSLSSAYRAGAVIAFLHDGTLDGFFHGMYLAACVRRRLLRCLARGMAGDPGERLAARDDALHEALCSGHGGVLDDLAGDTAGIEAAGGAPHERFFSLGLRALCRGDRDAARPSFTLFERGRGEAMEGPSQVAQGILAGDEAMFNEGLAAALGERPEPDEAGVGAAERWISVEHLALARLGQRLGLAVTTSHRLLPQALLGRARTAAPNADAVLPPVG